MTQEDKDLLLKDLCGRLPYETKMLFNNEHKFTLSQINPRLFIGKDGHGVIFDYGCQVYSVEDCKPYLRPMSSMTEEERNEHFGRTMTIDIVQTSKEVIDWLNKKMFDYRGLIEKGLALEAPEGMYELK